MTCLTLAKLEKSKSERGGGIGPPVGNSWCALKLYFWVTSDCAVGGAEGQKSRLPATRDVYLSSLGCEFAHTRAKRSTNRNRVRL